MIKVKKVQDYEIAEDDYVSECLKALDNLPPAKYGYGDLVIYATKTPSVVVGYFPIATLTGYAWKYYIRYISALSENIQQICVCEFELDPYEKEEP